jgi:hypothetical protein
MFLRCEVSITSIIKVNQSEARGAMMESIKYSVAQIPFSSALLLTFQARHYRYVFVSNELTITCIPIAASSIQDHAAAHIGATASAVTKRILGVSHITSTSSDHDVLLKSSLISNETEGSMI